MPAPLKLVPKAAPSAKERVVQRVKAAGRAPEILQCNRCGSREFIEAKQGVTLRHGKPSGGTKVLICVNCLLRGERVVVA